MYDFIAGMERFRQDPEEGRVPPIVTTGLSAGVSIAAALVLYLGIQPDVFLQLADSATALAR
jgi:NADH:ubiquinone oxidoreductase subunit 2 (subunit N)